MKFDLNKFLSRITEKVEVWISDFFSMLPNFLVAVVTMILFYVAAGFIKRIISKLLSKSLNNRALQNLFSRIVYIAIITFGLFTSLSVLHLDKTVTSLLAGVGVIGLALGFAFQDIAANFVSGTILAFKSPVSIGDIVEIDGIMGKVVDTNLRVTTIETFQGQYVYIPNKDVLQSKIINYTVTGKRRIDLAVGVSYGENLEKVRKVTLEAIQTVEGVKTDQDIIFDYHEFGGSSINFYIRFWITYPEQPSYLKVKSDSIMAIKRAFDQNGVTIPFPITTLDFGIKGGQKLSEMMNLSNGEKS